MKQLLFLLLSGWLLTGSAHAQAGLRLGAGLANPATATTEYSGYPIIGANGNALLGYHVGVYYQQKLTSWLSLVPEVQLSRERTAVAYFNYELLDSYVNSNYQLRLTYLNVPVLVRAAWGPVYLEAGPQLGVMLGGRASGSAIITGWGQYERDVDLVATDTYRRVDVGPCLGLGVKLWAGLGLSVRAYRGLVDLTKTPDQVSFTDYYYQGSMHRKTIQASLTYQLAAR